MPFDKKRTASGRLIDFNTVYNDLISEAIKEAGMEPLRADEELTGGTIHKPMYERLIFCEYAVADLTTANANVFYELGVRHAVRCCSTILIFAEGSGRLPFDVAPLRAIPYRLNDRGVIEDIITTKSKLVRCLVESKKASTDSPIYQLVDNYPNVDHEKMDFLSKCVHYSSDIENRLSAATKDGVDALRSIEDEIFSIKNVDSGIMIALFLSYREIKAWDEMISLVKKMSPQLAATAMVQEQYAFALNRIGKREEAKYVLIDLIGNRGPTSETYGLLGRVYKDQWEDALTMGEAKKAEGYLKKAIKAYRDGFETDWRDFYPGINAITLMEIQEHPDEYRKELIPIVTYTVQRLLATSKPDYWTYATFIELQVLAGKKVQAFEALSDALTVKSESFELMTTLRNLRLISNARKQRGEDISWYREIEEALFTSAKNKRIYGD
ncbi:hypothetical protein MBAV_003279 [Candidatus Magnetobacterium bavaricum]|uniref:MAP3K TRAFs-binding domain-containing protein n=1 Tax=Candidatus Magnetobacterium bavaricum TaxID=29290 RepID=A0A0F3GRF4_9BACT|nr:hypothetical protein MBAV_003279 [Candidatus Magnetobacterium bavaricum]